MTGMTTPENLIKLNFGLLADDEACGCEGACACGSQPIEFQGLTLKTSISGSGQLAVDSKGSGAVACC